MQTSPRRIARCLWGCIRSRSCVPFKSVYYTERDSHEITRCDSWGHEKEGPFATVDGIESPPPACPSLIRLTESSLSALKNGSGSGCETSRRSTYLTVSAGRNRQIDRAGIGSSQRAPLIQTPSPTPRRTLRQQSGPADSLPFRTGAPQQCEAMCTKGACLWCLRPSTAPLAAKSLHCHNARGRAGVFQRCAQGVLVAVHCRP
jgi:hypothetical protein